MRNASVITRLCGVVVSHLAKAPPMRVFPPPCPDETQMRVNAGCIVVHGSHASVRDRQKQKHRTCLHRIRRKGFFAERGKRRFPASFWRAHSLVGFSPILSLFWSVPRLCRVVPACLYELEQSPALVYFLTKFAHTEESVTNLSRTNKSISATLATLKSPRGEREGHKQKVLPQNQNNNQHTNTNNKTPQTQDKNTNENTTYRHHPCRRARTPP